LTIEEALMYALLAALIFYAITASLAFMRYSEVLGKVNEYWDVALRYAEKGILVSPPPLPSPPSVAFPYIPTTG
jgi:hypothetical protein